MKKLVWTTGRALLAIIAAAMIVDLILRVTGFLHGASAHTWLLDVQQNLGPDGAAGAAGAAAGSGGFNVNDRDVDPDSSPWPSWFNMPWNDPNAPSNVGQGTPPAGGGGGDVGKGGGGGDPGGLGTGTQIAEHAWTDSLVEWISAAAGEIGELLGPATTIVEGGEQMEKGMEIEDESHSATGGTNQSGGILTEHMNSDGSYQAPGAGAVN